jgi:hypothetical protein
MQNLANILTLVSRNATLTHGWLIANNSATRDPNTFLFRYLKGELSDPCPLLTSRVPEFPTLLCDTMMGRA